MTFGKRALFGMNCSGGRLVASAFAVVVTMAGFFLASPETAERVVRYGGYWFGLVAALMAVWAVWSLRVSFASSTFLKVVGKDAPLLLVFLTVGSFVLFSHSSFGPKIMMDDEILSATARSMHENREAYVPTFGRMIENRYQSFDGYVDKRPWLYPFLVSVLHDIIGFDLQNSYWLNAALGVLFLAVVLVLGHFFAGRAGAILFLLLWLNVPLLQQNASGGGMEMLNLALIGMLVLAGCLYLEKPSREGENLLSVLTVCLAYTRYESILFVLPILVIIALGWWREKKVFLGVGSILAAPILFGWLMLQKHFSAESQLWELHSGAESRFGLSNLSENLYHAAVFLFHWGGNYANSLLLVGLGIPALFLLLSLIFKHKRLTERARSNLWVATAFIGGCIAHFVVVLCYHDGRLDRLFASRFSLPLYFGLSIAILVVATEFLRRGTGVAKIAVGLCLLHYAVYASPSSARAVFTDRNYVVDELEWIEREWAAFDLPRALLVDDYPIYWTNRSLSAIPQGRAILHEGRIMQEAQVDGKYPAIFVIDRVGMKPIDGRPEPLASAFKPKFFELELINEASFKPFLVTRFYRVSNLSQEDRSAIE